MSPLPRSFKVLSHLLLFFTILVGAALAGGWFYFTTHQESLIREVRGQIEKNASQAIGLPIEVGNLNGSFFRGIEAENIEIWASEKRGAPRIAVIPRLTVRYSLLNILKLGKNGVRVDVYAPRATLARDEKGRLNLQPATQPAQKPGKKFRLPGISFFLHDGGFSWRDRLGKPFSASLEKLEGGGTLIDQRVSFELGGKNQEQKTADLHLVGESDLDKGSGNLDVRISGVPAKKWCDYLAPSPIWRAEEGTFDLGARLGWRKAALSLKGWTKLKDGKICLSSIKAPVEKIFGFARFNLKTVSVETVAGEVAGNSVHGSGSVIGIDTPNPKLSFLIDAPSIQLASTEKMFPEAKAFELKGSGRCSARAFGTPSDPRVEGTLSIPAGSAYKENIREVEGKFFFRNNAVTLSQVSAECEGGKITAEGGFTTEIEPQVKLSGSWRDVNLAPASAPYFKGAKGLTNGEFSIQGPAQNLLIEGRAKASGSMFGYRLENVSADFKVLSERWMVSGGEGELEGGRVKAEASGVIDGAVSGKFETRLPFRSLKKFGIEGSGTGEVEGSFRGHSKREDSWEASGTVKTAFSIIAKQPIESASALWSIKKERLAIRNGLIGVGGGRMKGNGTISLKGNPDASASLQVEGVELARVPLLQGIDTLGAVDGKASADLQISFLSGVLRAKGKVEGEHLAFARIGRIEHIEGPVYWGHMVLTTPGLDLLVGGQPLGISGSITLSRSQRAQPQFDLQMKAANADLASILASFQWRRLIDASSPESSDRIKDELFLPKRESDGILANQSIPLNDLLKHWQAFHREPIAHSEEIHLAKTPFWEALQGKVFLSANLSGSADNPSAGIKLQIREGMAYGKHLERAMLSASFRDNRISIPYLELSEAGDNGSILARGNLGNPDDRLTLTANRLRLDYLNPWLEESKIKVAGSASFSITLAGRLEEPKVLLSAKVEKGRVNEFAYDKAAAEASVQRGILSIERASISKEGKEATVFGSYPLLDPNRRIDLALRMEDESLGILMLFSQDQLEWRGGNGFVEVNLSGTPSRPNLSGRAELAGLALKIKGLTDPLTKIRGSLSLENNRLEVSTLTARFGLGEVQTSGHIQLENYLPKSLDLHLRSKPFRLRLENGLYDGMVETNVHLTGSPEEPVASGMILLNRGVITLKPSENGQKEAVTPLVLQDLTLSLGSGISLKSEPMIDLTLQGAMLVNGTLEKPLPRGSIKIKGGTIMTLTNAFSVSEGKAEFNGGPDANDIQEISASSNPLDAAVQIKAKSRIYGYEEKKYYNVTANVTGSLLNMKLDFESDPPLSQEQVLDILGKKQLIVQTINRQLNGSEILNRESSDWLNTLLTTRMVKPITNRMEDLLPFLDDIGFDLVSDSTNDEGSQVTSDKQAKMALLGMNVSLYAETKPIYGNLTLSYRHQFRNQNRNYFRAAMNYRLNRGLGLQLSLEPKDSPDARPLPLNEQSGLNGALQVTTQYRF